MNILITGAYGFVGTNLSNTLNDNHALWALDITEKKDTSYSRYFSWNELDTLPWNEVDTIIHLAGKAHDTKNQSEAKVYFDINTELTKKVFDRFLQSEAKKFIFFSSVKAAADQVVGEYLTEDVIPHPIGPYGESKIAAEEYILSKWRMESGEWRIYDELTTKSHFPLKRVYIFRPCMIHGPGNKGNLNLLYNVVSKGIPWPLGAFDNRRSFMNSWNLSWIVERFIELSPESGVYHLADDDAVSTNRLIELIAESKKKKAIIWRCNRSFINVIARIGSVCKLPLNSDRLQKLTENYVVSNSKVKASIGVNELPVKTEDGLKKTLEYFEL